MTRRAAVALLLAAALLALPGWTAAAPAATCCGVDCSPCPLSFCKTTRADRALVPTVPVLGLAAASADEIIPVGWSSVAASIESGARHTRRAFHPLRN